MAAQHHRIDATTHADQRSLATETHRQRPRPGAAITLAGALTETWQFAILAAAVVAHLVLRRGVVPTLLGAALIGVIAALAGAPLS